MQPYVSVAASLVPELVPLIEGDRAGTLEPTIARTVADTTRATSPADAMKAVKANEKLASQLETRLRKIAAVAEKIQSEDVLNLSEDWATAPSTSVPPKTAATALEWRKLRLEERIIALREEEFLRIRAKPSQRSPLVMVALILGACAICATAIFAVQDALSGFARATAANADLAAAETYLAAAQLTQPASAALQPPAPLIRPAAPPAPTPAELEASAFTALAATPPATLFGCAAPPAAATRAALAPKFPAEQPQLATLYLQAAAACGPADEKLTRTQQFYAAAAELGPPLKLTTIYIDYPSPAQASQAQALAAKLQQNPAFVVLSPQQAVPAIAPTRPEINYYTAADASLAQTLATAFPGARPNFFREHLANIPPGVIEIWFPR